MEFLCSSDLYKVYVNVMFTQILQLYLRRLRTKYDTRKSIQLYENVHFLHNDHYL